MKHSVFLASKKNEQRTIKGLLILVGVLAFSTALSLLITVTRHTDTKTVIVPMSAKQPFWISNSAVSENYLADMGEYVITQFLTLTDGNLAHHRDVIMQLAAPDTHAELTVALNEQAKKVKASQLSISFYPQTVDANANTLTATVTGLLRRYTAQHLLEETQKTYQVSFRFNHGRLWLAGVILDDEETVNGT